MKTNSTSLRLLLVFAIGLIILFALFQWAVGHSLNKEIETLNAHSALRATHVIIGRRSRADGKINFNRAARFSERSGLRIAINTGDQNWFSDSEFSKIVKQLKTQTFRTLKLKPLRRSKQSSPIVEVTKFQGNLLYKVNTPHAVLFIEIPDKRQHRPGLFFLIALAFLGLMYAAIRYLFAPVSEISDVVSKVANGDLHARTQIKRNDDLGELALKVNEMAMQIQQRVESKHSLLLGISHELRSPLTRARITTELLNDKARKKALTDDLAEIEHIIAELTEAEKLSEHSTLHRKATNINALMTNLIDESFTQFDINFQPLADNHYLNIDPIRIKLLTKNLLSNAIKYTPKGKSPPELLLSIEGDYLQIRVVDFGVGVSLSVDLNNNTDQLEKLKEPFYRADSARQRETGGYGLGLYLCDVICKAHNGKLTLTSKEIKEGTIATALIKLSDS